jgi:putative transposase
MAFRIASHYAREAQYRVIEHFRGHFAVKTMCAFFGLSRAAYYAWRQRTAAPDRDASRLVQVLEVYQRSHRTYGYRRITLQLQRQQRINHKAVLRLMRKAGIASIARRRRIQTTRAAKVPLHRYPNVLARDFTALAPNQKWVTDVTYVRTQQGWAYLATVKDLFDGFIVAHTLGRQNSVALVTQTVQRALEKEKVTAGLILHSDQGHQYSSQPYFALTQEYTIVPSMSRRGNCWDNAPMENFFGHLKAEALQHVKNPSFAEVTQLLESYLYFYNYERLQLKTKQTPFERRRLLL